MADGEKKENKLHVCSPELTSSLEDRLAFVKILEAYYPPEPEPATP